MLLSLVYFVLGCLLRAVVRSDRTDLEREAELLVLRHQLKVLSKSGRRRRRSGGETGFCSRWPAGSSRAIGGRRSW